MSLLKSMPCVVILNGKELLYVHWYVQLECTHIHISLIVFESTDKEHQPAFDSPSRANLTIALNVECEKNDKTDLVFYSGSFYFIITIIISLPKITIPEWKRKSIWWREYKQHFYTFHVFSFVDILIERVSCVVCVVSLSINTFLTIRYQIDLLTSDMK